LRNLYPNQGSRVVAYMSEKNPAAELGRLGGKKGGKVRAETYRRGSSYPLLYGGSPLALSTQSYFWSKKSTKSMIVSLYV
jgi:hypothetical protein